jgi:hypothetical protein
VAYPARATTLDGFLGVPRITSWSDVLLMTKFDTASVQACSLVLARDYSVWDLQHGSPERIP